MNEVPPNPNANHNANLGQGIGKPSGTEGAEAVSGRVCVGRPQRRGADLGYQAGTRFFFMPMLLIGT